MSLSIKRLGLISAWMVALAFVTGCEKKAEQDSDKDKKSNQPGVGVQVGDIAHEIEGVDIGGDAFKLSDYRGKVVMLDFWAST